MSRSRSRRRLHASLLGCVDVAGLDLAPGRCSESVAFRIDVLQSDADFPATEVLQRGPGLFTLSSTGVGVCDVDLVERTMTVRAPHRIEHDRIAHFVADVVIPRVASLEGRCLHAAALAINDRAFVLLGPSGSGKSTLAARLALEGASLLGDDCALVKDTLVHPAHRPSRLWPDSAKLLGLSRLTPDKTGKVSIAEEHGIVRSLCPAQLQEVLVVDAVSRNVELSEAIDLLLHETMRLVIPEPKVVLDDALEFLRSFGPRRTIARDATLADLRAL